MITAPRQQPQKRAKTSFGENQNNQCLMKQLLCPFFGFQCGEDDVGVLGGMEVEV